MYICKIEKDFILYLADKKFSVPTRTESEKIIYIGEHPNVYLGELLVSVDVHDDDDLDEGDQGQPSGSIGVHEGQPVLSGAGGEQDAHQEAEETAAT
jgi:hypothetical protein